MTFLGSLLNDLDDIEKQYQNESKLWNSFYFLKNFNNRKCECIDTYLNDIDGLYEHNLNDEENLICKCQYPLHDQQLIYNDIELIIPLNDQYHIEKLSDTQISQVVQYLKYRGIQTDHNDFIYNDVTGKLQKCTWNDILIEIYNLKPKDIEIFKKEYKKNKIMVFARNWNMLHYLDGMSTLQYSK